MGGFYLPGLLLWASQFSLLLVGLAFGLCLTGSYAVMILLRRARVLQGTRRLSWFLALCLCFGADVWATHFIAMLAFDPGIPVYYDAGRTALSILVAVLGAVPAFALLIWRPQIRFVWALAGVLLGGAIAAMHVIGMSAIEPCGSFGTKPAFVLAGLACAMILAALAMRAKLRSGMSWPVGPSLLLAASISCLHFIAMGGLVLSPKAGWAFQPVITGTDKGDLAAAIAGVSLLLLVTLLVSATADAKLVERQLETKRLWHLARHDDLTGLLNRRGLRERLGELAATPGLRPMLISVGLERLKPVNDLFGRELVEKLFCQAAERLVQCLERGDILALPGGDEFVVLRAELSGPDDSIALAQQAHRLLV